MAIYETKVVQMGDGLGVIIPDEIVKALDLKINDEFSVEVKGDSIIFKPIKKNNNHQ